MYVEKFRRYMAEPVESGNKYHSEVALMETVYRRPNQDGCREMRFAIGDILRGCKITSDLPADRSKWDGKPYWVYSRRVGLRSTNVEKLVRYRAAHPTATFGIDVQKVYDTRCGQVCIYGKVNALEGAHVLDPKPIFDPADTGRLLDQCQWQFYLDVTGCKTYHFDMFEVRGYRGLQDGRKDGMLYAHDITISDPERHTFHAFPTMHDRLTDLVGSFMEWVEYRNISALFQTAK